MLGTGGQGTESLGGTRGRNGELVPRKGCKIRSYTKLCGFKFGRGEEKPGEREREG